MWKSKGPYSKNLRKRICSKWPVLVLLPCPIPQLSTLSVRSPIFDVFLPMLMSDIVERFHLWLLLTLILVRNLIEHTNSLTTPLKLPWMDLCMPFIMVLGSELMVDWCKHAFVTKFNHIRPSIYTRFMDVLCLDFVKDGREVPPPSPEKPSI